MRCNFNISTWNTPQRGLKICMHSANTQLGVRELPAVLPEGLKLGLLECIAGNLHECGAGMFVTFYNGYLFLIALGAYEQGYVLRKERHHALSPIREQHTKKQPYNRQMDEAGDLWIPVGRDALFVPSCNGPTGALQAP